MVTSAATTVTLSGDPGTAHVAAAAGAPLTTYVRAKPVAVAQEPLRGTTAPASLQRGTASQETSGAKGQLPEGVLGPREMRGGGVPKGGGEGREGARLVCVWGVRRLAGAGRVDACRAARYSRVIPQLKFLLALEPRGLLPKRGLCKCACHVLLHSGATRCVLLQRRWQTVMCGRSCRARSRLTSNEVVAL